MEVNLFIAFLSGLIIGATPCIFLMMSAFGTSLVLIEERSKFLKISVGLICGLIVAYLIISFLFLFFLPVLEVVYLFKYVFAGILIFVGAWQILESTNAESTIFGTPKKVKNVLKRFIEKQSGAYAFLVGIIFVLIKIPCFGGVYLALLYNLHENPILYVFIIVYMMGMIIPVMLILVALRCGLESEKVNEFRLDHRAKLRILSGIVLIFLAIYLLILDDLFSNLFN